MKDQETNVAAAPETKTHNRWSILVCGILLLASLGGVYAWSVLTDRLKEAYKWTNTDTSIVFSLAVAGLGLSAAYTGPLVSKLGARRLVFRSAAFYSAGYLISALALYLKSWWLLCLGYGVIGGIGLGTGYVTGVTTIAGWFPDRKGFATGLIVMGFGMGSLIMSKILVPRALELANQDLPKTFLIIGLAFLVFLPLVCLGIHSPTSSGLKSGMMTAGEQMEHGAGLQVTLWVLCFLYSLAGLGIISMQSPLMKRVAGVADPSLDKAALEVLGATFVAWASVSNSTGRLFWASVSDRLGRVNTFVVFLATAAVAFLILPEVKSPLLFGCLLAYTLASYGGGFGTIPSLISDLYGPKRMSPVHGKVLTGWATAGVTAPTIFGWLRDTYPPDQAATYAFYGCAVVLFLAAALAFTLRSLHTVTTKPHALDSAADDPA